MNQKLYIGSSGNIYGRIVGHKSNLKTNKHNNPRLQRAYNKYGENMFVYFMLEQCSEEQLLNKEDWWMALYETRNRNKGFNFKDALRQTHSEESKKKISRSQIGRLVSNETRKKISETLMGHKVSPETKNKISETVKIRIQTSPDIREKIRGTQFKKGQKSHDNTGRIASQETREKMSRSMKAKFSNDKVFAEKLLKQFYKARLGRNGNDQ